MNWIEIITPLLTDFDWVKVATAAIALFVAWRERKNVKTFAVGAAKKAYSLVSRKAVVEDERPEIHAAIRKVEAYSQKMKCPKLREQCSKACEDLYPLSYRTPADKPEDSQ